MRPVLHYCCSVQGVVRSSKSLQQRQQLMALQMLEPIVNQQVLELLKSLLLFAMLELPGLEAIAPMLFEVLVQIRQVLLEPVPVCCWFAQLTTY